VYFVDTNQFQVTGRPLSKYRLPTPVPVANQALIKTIVNDGITNLSGSNTVSDVIGITQITAQRCPGHAKTVHPQPIRE